MLKSNNISPPPAAKLYYTSFWDKFGRIIIYFGMHPKSWKTVWDGFQLQSILDPDQPPDIFLLPNQIEKLASKAVFQSIWHR